MKSSPKSTRGKSREPSPDQANMLPLKLRAACESCHVSKVKCLGGKPCPRCSANRSECIYQPAAKIGKPKGSRNKSTLERLRKEEAQRQEAERIKSQGVPSYSVESGPSSYYQNGSVASSPTDTGTMPPVSSHMPPWNYIDSSRNWPGDSEVPGGTFQLVSGQISPAMWAYGNERGTVDCIPSVMSRAPLNEAMLQGGNVDYLQEMDIHPNTSDTVHSRLPSLTSDSSYTSSPWSGSATAPTLHSDVGSTVPTQTFFTDFQSHSFPAHDSCHCAETLAGQLCGFRHPEALNSTAHSVDGFITNTDHLLFAVNSFLKCEICQKNSMALSLLATTFATFGQLFAALTATPSRQPSPSRASPGLTALSFSLGNQLSLGTYQAANQEGSAVRAMIIAQTVPKWRDVCFKAVKLLEYLQARSQGYGFNSGELEIGIATGGDGTPLWGPADIDSFARVVDRVDSELAVYS